MKTPINKFIFLTAIIIIASFFNIAFSATAGSDSTEGTPQSYYYFPATENDTNKIANYAIMDNGFYLEDSTTTCSFSSIFPVDGNQINLNGGRLFLFRDLIMTSTSTNIYSPGKIHGNGFSMKTSKCAEDLSYSYTFRDIGIHIAGCLTFNAPTTFYGTSFINGNCGTFELGNNGYIEVADGNLTLENAEIINLKSTNIRCKQNNASITIKNCRLHLSDDFYFNTGSILFDSDVIISGTSKFIYQTTQTSTIASYSNLYIDNGVTFKYNPSTDNRNLIYMTDRTSCLILDNSTLHSTTTGIRLTNGTLFIDNSSTLYSDGSHTSESICFGNGDSSNDLNINLLSGANVNVYGSLEYENTF